jgi:hypothetical protein
VAEWKPDDSLNDAHQLDSIYLSSLSRYPADPVRERILSGLAGRDRRAVYQDVLWAILNSKEFLYNH